MRGIKAALDPLGIMNPGKIFRRGSRAYERGATDRAAPPCEAPAPAPLLELRGISKTFPGVKALDDVSLGGLRRRSPHAARRERRRQIEPDEGAVRRLPCRQPASSSIKGEKVAIASTAGRARRLGIAVIFQEFSLVPYLDIAQNIFLGREPKGRIPGTHRPPPDARATPNACSTRIGFDIDPTIAVAKLGVAQQQMVEIAKGRRQNARILVMDEPTAALSDRETELLFGADPHAARRMASPSSTSRIAWHEVFTLGDRITVLRDGRRVGEVRPGRRHARTSWCA